MAKQRARRGEPPLPAATVVIRGDVLDPDALAESAQPNFDGDLQAAGLALWVRRAFEDER